MTDTAATSWLQAIPGAQSALNYVLGQVAAFQSIPSRLQIVNLWLNKIQATVGGPAIPQAQALQQTMQAVQSDYAANAAALGTLLPQLQGAGLLGLDLGMIGNMISLAAAIENSLAAVGELESETSSLAQSSGVGNPGIGSSMSGFGKYLLYGGLVYLGFWAVRHAKGSRRY